MLKKFLLVLLLFTFIIIFLSLWPSPCRSQEVPVKTDSLIWTKNHFDDGSEMYFTKGCRVFVPAPKNKVKIVVLDINWAEGVLEQVIEITTRTNGKIKKVEVRYVIDKDFIFKQTRGYDVFAEKYQKSAKIKLPPEIQNLFHGYYEMGTAPIRK